MIGEYVWFIGVVAFCVATGMTPSQVAATVLVITGVSAVCILMPVLPSSQPPRHP